MANRDPTRAQLQPRTGQPDPMLTRTEFDARFRQRFHDPAFAPLEAEIARLASVAWDAYDAGRKAPRTQPAGAGFADPDYQLSDEWRAIHDALQQAERRQRDPPRRRGSCWSALRRAASTPVPARCPRVTGWWKPCAL